MKRYTRKVLGRFHRDDGGAILLLLLAAFLILMMMAWTLYDSGEAARQKIKVQAAADTAAASQVAVKARAMNMMAYSNVAKRSIFAIHTAYISHFLAYIKWAGILYSIGEALINVDFKEIGTEVASAATVWIQWWEDEARNDFKHFSNIDLVAEESLSSPDSYKLDIGVSTISNILEDDWAQAFSGKVTAQTLNDYAFADDTAPWGGYSLRYHAQDIKALDNYQRYLAGVTPWWAWSEHVVRGMRNGASATGSFPLPYTFNDGTDDILARISATLGGGAQSANPTTVRDTLPIRPGDRRDLSAGVPLDERMTMAAVIERQLDGANPKDLLKDLIAGGTPDFENMSDMVFFVEHMINIVSATLASDYPTIRIPGGIDFDNPLFSFAANAIADAISQVGFGLVVGLSTHTIFVNQGLQFTQDLFDQELGAATASPWLLLRYPTEGEWLLKTSNIIFSYLSRHELYEEEREKFDILSNDYEIVDPITGFGGPLGTLGESIYRSSGYWAMARGEIFFNAEASADLWNPVWNSRLRPLALVGEFEEAQIALSDAYHDAVMSMVILSMLDITNFHPRHVLMDFVQMERNLRGMGPATVQGVVK